MVLLNRLFQQGSTGGGGGGVLPKTVTKMKKNCKISNFVQNGGGLGGTRGAKPNFQVVGSVIE